MEKLIELIRKGTALSQPELEAYDAETLPCAIDRYFRDNPEATTAWISCHCPKCSPRMF